MSLTVIFLFISFFLLPLLFLFGKHLSNIWYRNLPPGNIGFPLIGETFSFRSAGRQGYPEKFVTDRVRRFSSSVFKTHLFGYPFAVVTGASGNRFLFSNENKLVVSWWPDSVYKIFHVPKETNSTDEAIRQRMLLAPSLKPEALKNYVGIMDEVVQRHFDTEWANQDQLIVFPLARKFTFAVACRLFMSIDDEGSLSKLKKPFNAVLAGLLSFPIDFPGTSFNRAIKAYRLIRKDIATIVRQRKEELKAGKASAEQDILTHLLMTIGEVKDEYLADMIFELLNGGYESTSIICTFVVNYLAEYPHVYQRVLQEHKDILKEKEGNGALTWEDISKMKYSWNFAREVMRVVPISSSFREAIENFSFKGFNIPKGWKLSWSAAATHKNPEYFPEPEKFEPNRFEGTGPKPYTYVPFGGGPRSCPGREYARIVILVFMHHLVKRFKWEKVFPEENRLGDPGPMPARGLPIRIFSQSGFEI